MKTSSLSVFIMTTSIIFSIYPVYGATVFYANGAFTQNGIEWCEENKPLYDILGDRFFEHHRHSIESRVCANLIEDELWNYSGPDRVEKLIERSLYFSELEIAESQLEADIGIVDTTPADVPDRMNEEPEPVLIQVERKMKKTVKTVVVLNEKEACVSFPKIDGDSNITEMFFSTDPKFHEWCLDYFRYSWYGSDIFRERKLS